MIQYTGRSGLCVRRDGFTIVEVMLVVIIVAILSLVAMPMYSGHLKSSKMSEGITAVGMIRTALRTYSAGNSGRYPALSDADGTQLKLLNVTAADLAGKYFRPANYLVNSTAESYTVKATLAEDSSYWYQVDAAGNETKSY